MTREDTFHFYAKTVIDEALLCIAPGTSLETVERLGKHIEAVGKHIANHAAYYKANPEP